MIDSTAIKGEINVCKKESAIDAYLLTTQVDEAVGLAEGGKPSQFLLAYIKYDVLLADDMVCRYSQRSG